MNKQEEIKALASEIRRLNKRVKQLEEAGQNVVDYIESEHGKQTALVFETWYKVKGSNENNLVINRNTGSVNFSDKWIPRKLNYK